ncbi:MAG: hypothetical protein WCP12_05190 [bacterium]
MKLWHLLPFTLLAGLLIGRWLPNEETRIESAVRMDISTQKNTDALNNITRIVQIPDKAAKPRRRAPAVTNQPPEIATNAISSGQTNTNAPAVHKQHHERLSPEDLRARIDEAKDLWRTRAELARVQMLDKLGLKTVEQQTHFDNAINTMNQTLFTTMQGLATEVKNAPEMTTEQGIRVVAQMTAAMTTAYDSLFQAVPQDKQSEVGKMQMTDFIDPNVIEPLTEVQDKFQNMRPPFSH